ncbi:phosphatase PAP2 family protein [Hymenobacter terrenus]|uniref:phosphatase PAP2 family protein n=1 Tax=Hymenobacter terrenus TaxID=1629124 RepID=UPI0006982A5D|nr:phosphatase PAP2 family protein [Hymenobacter terrenus]
MKHCYPSYFQRLLVALLFYLSTVPASFANLPRLTADAPASISLGSAPDTLATTNPAVAQPMPALSELVGPTDSLPHIHPRDANGRITDYTVAPGVTWHYDKPRPFHWAIHIPRDLGQFPGYAFRKDNLGLLTGLVVSSAALWVADQTIVDEAQRFGRAIDLTAPSRQKTLVRIPFRIGSINLPFEFNGPDNLNSAFYFIGDGWTHLTVASSFWIYGGIRKDNRALQTSSQLGEAILSTGLVVQTLKRITGRQSPFVSTKDRGEWHLFPSFSTYQSAVPKYDAYPTGHLATAMATVTVIAENYPEHRFIRPMGYSMMGLLGYSMLNNGVHWASDYPIGIALGYAFAKIAVRNGRTRVEVANDPSVHGTGMVRPHQPQPWYRQGQFAPYAYGPFTGASWTLRL